MLRAAGSVVVGLGVTVASTFAPALGLSVHQQRIGFALGIALIVVGCIVFLLSRGREPAASRLRLGAPVMAPNAALPVKGGPGNEWRFLEGKLIQLPVVNEQGAETAAAVHATVRFTDEKRGLDRRVAGQWAGRELWDRPEIDIPGNGRPYLLNLYVQLPNLQDDCYIWNQESVEAGVRAHSFYLDSEEFWIEIQIQGAHRDAVARGKWRAWPLSAAQFAREGEEMPVERAIREAEEAEEAS